MERAVRGEDSDLGVRAFSIVHLVFKVPLVRGEISGRLGEGGDWAVQVRYRSRGEQEGSSTGVRFEA